jgi:glycosyltransferase involved in cell wall biosynthesis
MTYEYIMNSTEFYSIMKFQYNHKIIQQNEIQDINPKIDISIIIYIIEFDFIEDTIQSIQNQNFINYEIILIYDNDNETEFEKLENFTKIFDNIVLINNEGQFGLYYSYSLGIMEAKGEYILILLSGYTLSNYYVLDKLYKNIIKENVDILEFNLLINYNGNNTIGDSLSIYKCTHVNTEIQLNFFKYNLNYKNVDEEKEILINKLIKSNILKNIIRKYKFNRRKNKLFNYFDDIILFLLNKIKAKFKHIDDYCMIQYINRINNSTLFKLLNNDSQLYQDSLFYINFIFDNSNNNLKDKKLVLYEFYNIMGFIYNKFVKSNNETKLLYQKFIISKYFSNEDKDELRFYYKSLNN